MPETMGDGPNLYEFLLEAELAHYYNALKNDLKVASVSQLKYVEEDDLAHVGMSKPEQRRLRKFYQKYFPQTYLMKIKKMILPKMREDSDRASILSMDSTLEKSPVRTPSKHIISAESIVINKELGVGEFGVVQQGVWTNEDGDRIQVAIKCLSKERMQNNYMEFLKEAVIMHSIDHEHIVRLYGVVLDTTALMLVTELAPLRSLLECLKEPALKPSFPVISLCDFALQICDGMQYLEDKRLIHRDLAARNILVFAKNKVKISDFGLSRALGVGKDYYQTNFNVNLKLPIAWCAPECINYLRFTSASDVWAYAVTLWEMFSYGFQPWAALTGQQILEAIDEPNFQRLEQPECCPKEYYTLMLRCWQHDPNKRPNFADILYILPECKPEQVQAVKDFSEPCASSRPKEWLVYRVGEVITVLDKRPLADSPQIWKGVLCSGKTGLFNPANSVAYLGQNLPTNKPNFCRGDSKMAGMYASRRRLRPEMISGPQGDLKHTGHVGLDGAFFGDISFLGDKYQQLPKQIVTPCGNVSNSSSSASRRAGVWTALGQLIRPDKPHEDGEQSSLTRASSDLSDKAPLLSKSSSVVDGKSGPACETWSVTFSENVKSCGSGCSSSTAVNGGMQKPKANGKFGPDHEYHEISDDEDFAVSDSPPFESLDFGPSLMDEVFKALSSQDGFDLDEQQSNESNNVKNEIKEITSRALGGRDTATGKVKKQATVKPISAADQQTLDSAIAMAKELASKSMLDLDCRSDQSDTAQNSPKTPNSPTKRKFSFKFKTSPKQERRNFSEEAESIPDFQDTLSEEAKEAYASLVEKGQGLAPSASGATSGFGHQENGAPVSPRHFRSSLRTFKPSLATAESLEDEADDSINPLRMLRIGGPVRPKIRGNKHGIPSSGRATTPHTATVARLAANAASSAFSGTSSLGRAGLGSPPPPPANMAAKGTTEGDLLDQVPFADSGPSECQDDQTDLDSLLNPLPLPPRDRSKPLPVLKQHERRYPLVLPGSADTLPKRPLSKQVSCPEVPPNSITSSPPSWRRGISLSESDASSPTPENAQAAKLTSVSSPSASDECPRVTKTKGSSLDDSFETKIQAEIDGLDDIPEEKAPSPPMCKKTDHVSCEDLLEFAMDKPNAKRTQGRARGLDSDEVRIMQKVLVKEQLAPEECLQALNETDWDIHKAIKYVRLQRLVETTTSNKQTLVRCNWDVQQAANYLLATRNVPNESTEV